MRLPAYVACNADVDECSSVAGVCNNGRCINMAGGYRCECHPGYRPTSDHKHCIGLYIFTIAPAVVFIIVFCCTE